MFIQSTKFSEENLPERVLAQLAKLARTTPTIPGSGKFRYVGMRIAKGERQLEIVVSLVERHIQAGNILAEPDDVVFHLLSEWDQETKNVPTTSLVGVNALSLTKTESPMLRLTVVPSFLLRGFLNCWRPAVWLMTQP